MECNLADYIKHRLSGFICGSVSLHVLVHLLFWHVLLCRWVMAIFMDLSYSLAGRCYFIALIRVLSRKSWFGSIKTEQNPSRGSLLDGFRQDSGAKKSLVLSMVPRLGWEWGIKQQAIKQVTGSPEESLLWPRFCIKMEVTNDKGKLPCIPTAPC